MTLAALAQFDKQVADALGHSRGRHRKLAEGAAAPEDTWGYNLKPNPLLASTSAEFVTALRRYRAWAGNISFRQMAERAHYAVAHSTMCVALNKEIYLR